MRSLRLVGTAFSAISTRRAVAIERVLQGREARSDKRHHSRRLMGHHSALAARARNERAMRRLRAALGYVVLTIAASLLVVVVAYFLATWDAS